MTRALLLALAVSTVATAALADSLIVPIDQSRRLNVTGAAASVVVGNPQVADVTVVDSHTVYVSGRGYGETDVIVLDGAGRPLYTGEVTVTSPNAGRVSIYRGAARTDMACAPSCEVTFRSPTKGDGSGSAGGALAQGGGGGQAANPAAALAGMMGGMMNGVAAAATHTVAPGPSAH